MKTSFLFAFLIYATGCSLKSVEQSDKILFVVSNAHYYGDSDIHTANHFAEIVFAYDAFVRDSYQVDFISPEGGAIPLGYIYSDTLLKRYLYDASFMDKLEETKSPGEVDPGSYSAIFFAGGGSAMFGVPENTTIHEITREIYEQNGGVVSAVCHGTAGIANIQTGNNTYLVSGRRINGFPDLFENKAADYFKEFPFSIEEQVKKNGGDFSFSSEGWDGYYVADGRIITGQDPTSSALVAKAVIEKLTEQNLN